MNIQAPLQLENLLPYDIRYLVYDKATKQDYRDVLRRGQRDSIHVVDPSHILALSVQVLETDFKASAVGLISSADMDLRDDYLELKDDSGRQLLLGLRYRYN